MTKEILKQYTDLQQECDEVREKTVPTEWINAEGNFVTEDFINYALPLIKGESEAVYEDGLPRYAKLKKVYASQEVTV